MPFSFFSLTLLIEILVFLVAIIFLRKLSYDIGKNHLNILSFVWIAWVSLEFWVFGPHSFIHGSQDLQVGLSTHLIGLSHLGGNYSHSLAGGTDLASSSLAAGQLVSLERFLLHTLPIWLANSFAQVLGKFVGFWGTYLICRKGIKCTFILSFGLATFFTVSIHYIAVYGTWVHGLGYSLTPISIYLVVFRYGKPYYYSGIAVVALVHAISSSPTHSDIAFYSAIAFSGILLSWRRLISIIPAMLIILFTSIINWAESIYAKYLISPLSYRGNNIIQQAAEYTDLIEKISSLKTMYIEEMILVGFCIVTIITQNVLRKFTKLSILFSALFLGLMLEQIPWNALGLSVFGTINFFAYMTPSIVIIVIIIIASLVTELSQQKVGVFQPKSITTPVFRQFFVTILLALSISQSFKYKFINLSTWLSEGGISQTQSNLTSLKNNDYWRPKEPFRVVSIPYRLAPQIPIYAGIDTLDGNHSVISNNITQYWMNGILKNYRNIDDSYLGIYDTGVDFKCCERYSVSELVNLNLLGVLNVSHLLSLVPLEGKKIIEVTNFSSKQLPARNTESTTARFNSYLKQNFSPPPLRVYQLNKYLPRVYVAKKLIKVKNNTTTKELLSLVSDSGLDRVAFVYSSNIKIEKFENQEIEIKSFAIKPDKILLEVSSKKVGMIIINVPFSPYWRAESEGKQLDIFPVNLAQMAIIVHPGVDKISLDYTRTNFWSELWKLVFVRQIEN